VAGLLELSDKADLQPRQLINYLSQRAGLLYERGVRVYTFPHRTFQEYLAACHLTSKTRFPTEMAELLRSDPNRWREVTLLAAAKAKTGAIYTFWALIDRLRRAGSGEAWGMLLAGQAIDEGIDLAALEADEVERLAVVRQGLVGVLEGSELPALERALAVRTLAHLGDPRREVMTIDEMRFCYVPAGPFLRTDKGCSQAQIDYGYWLGCYPLTNAQFAAFVAGGGYGEARYWPEAIKKKYWSAQGFMGLVDNEPRTAPYRFREPYSLPNHPVVGVTWYEALAFCRWLGEQIVPTPEPFFGAGSSPPPNLPQVGGGIDLGLTMIVRYGKRSGRRRCVFPYRTFSIRWVFPCRASAFQPPLCDIEIAPAACAEFSS
jgi:hypothetical protein